MDKSDHREYGFAQVQVTRTEGAVDALFEGLGDEMQVRSLLIKIFGSSLLILSQGLDVSRRSTLSNPSQFPRYRAHTDSPLCCHRP